MANSFLTVEEIAERSLPFLEANLAFAGVVNRNYGSEYKRRGDTVQVRKPEIFSATEFDEGAGVTFGEVAEDSVSVSLDTVLTVDKKIGSAEMTMNINDFEIQYVMPAMKGLADAIDVRLARLYRDIPYSVGAAASTPDAITDITGCKNILESNKAPRSPRYFVIDEDAEAKFLELDTFGEADKAGTTSAQWDGFLGRKYGFDIAMDQNVQTHIKGTLAGTPLTNSAVAGSILIPVNGATASTTLLYGDLIQIAGNQYVVTANVTLVGGAGNVGIYPPLAASSNDEAVTITGSAVNNLAFHKDAFALVNRPLEPAMGGAQSATVNMGGLSVRVTYGYDMTYKRNMLTWDMLLGFKTLYPELAVRLLG